MYSVKIEDCGTGNLMGLGFGDITFNGDGKVEKLYQVEKCVQQAKLINFHRKTKKNWWNVNYGSYMLVFVGRKSVPIMYLYPLQVSIGDSLDYLKFLQKSRGLDAWERLGNYEVHTLINNTGTRLDIEIKITTEAQVAASMTI